MTGSEYPEAGEVLVWWVCLSQSYSSKIQTSKSQCGHRLKTGKTASLTVHVAMEEAGRSEEAKHQRHTFHKQFILNHVGLLCCRMQKLGVQNL